MTKKELRLKYKALRKQLAEDEVEELSLSIANQLLLLPVWQKTYFHIFLSITELKEVDTLFVMHVLSGRDKEIVVSKSDFEAIHMSHFLLTENTVFKKNERNIPEPVDGLEVPTAKIEVVFIPLLAFDAHGNRVGYGKGFYDKFLSKCLPGTVKIGLSYFEAEASIDDAFEGDVKLDFCVTPERIYTF